MTKNQAFEVELKAELDEAIEKLTAALKQESFGVLTRIDVHTTFKKKLDVDFQPYAILGVCNPKLAHRALTQNPSVGLMLPCPATVEQRPGGDCLVRIGDPQAFMGFGGFGDDPVLRGVAEEARDRLLRVAQSLSGT